MKTVLITGVSTGIGYATAAALLARGVRVFGSVRSSEAAARVSRELSGDFTALWFDVTDADSIAREIAKLAEALGGKGLTALVNNAGISEPAPLMHVPLEEFRAHLEINVTGALAVTQACLPLLGAVKDCAHALGRVVNIGSVSGKIAYPFMGAYAASKFALEAMSDSLRRELLLYGIDVIVIEPSTVQTPMVDKFIERLSRYRQTDYGAALAALLDRAKSRQEVALPVSRVTDVIIEAIDSPSPRTRYPIPRNRLTSWLLPRYLPDRVVDRLAARAFGLGKASSRN